MALEYRNNKKRGCRRERKEKEKLEEEEEYIGMRNVKCQDGVCVWIK